MTRFLAAVVVIVATMAVTMAQADPRMPLGRLNPLSIEVIEQDSKNSWRVAGRADIRVEDLMSLFAGATQTLVSYSDSTIQRHSVNYTAPEKGILLDDKAIPMFVSDLLHSVNRYTMVGFTEGRTRVMSADEAHGYARYIDPGALASMNEAEWVIIRVPLERVEARWIVGMLDNTLGEAKRSMRLQAVGSFIVISGRVDRVRRLHRFVLDLDSSATTAMSEHLVRSFDVPAGVKAVDIITVIGVHFPVSTTTVTRETGASVTETRIPRVTASISTNGAKVVARGTKADLNQVESLINAMK